MNFLFNEVTPAKTTVQFNKRGQGGLASYWYSTLDHLQVYQCSQACNGPIYCGRKQVTNEFMLQRLQLHHLHLSA